MKMFMLRCIAAMVAVAALSQPRSSHADFIVTGNWTGLEIVTSENTGTGSYSQQLFLTDFSLTYDTTTTYYTLSFENLSGYGLGGNIGYSDQNIIGDIFYGSAYFGADIFNLFVSYASIPDDGVLDNSNSSAGFSASEYSDINRQYGSFTVTGYSFSTSYDPSLIPEPSSFALASAALLTLATWAGIKRRRTASTPRA